MFFNFIYSDVNIEGFCHETLICVSTHIDTEMNTTKGGQCDSTKTVSGCGRIIGYVYFCVVIKM